MKKVEHAKKKNKEGDGEWDSDISEIEGE